MSLFIKGMKMPKNGDELLSIDIWPSGKVSINLDPMCKEVGTAIEVSTPHGKLKDEKWIKEYITDTIKGFEEMNRSDLQNYSLIAGLRTVEVMIEHAPTIIEAEE